jgi:peptide chain release factor 3
MVIDAAKGIEARTRKLFEVCRLRDIPIVTFINKMDREARDPFEILDEIEKTLALDTTPMTWPIGMGRDFAGTYDIASGDMRLMSEDGKTVERQPLDLTSLGAREGSLPAVRFQIVPRGTSHACVLRFGAEEFRGEGPARCARLICAAAARARLE